MVPDGRELPRLRKREVLGADRRRASECNRGVSLRYARALEQYPQSVALPSAGPGEQSHPIICLGATATGLDIHPDTGQVNGLEVVTIDRNRKIVHARAYVLACGGLETTRFLLNQQVKYPRLLGGEEGPLGRFYMGHLPGKIADIVLSETFPSSLLTKSTGSDRMC